MIILKNFSSIFDLPQGPQDAVCITTNGMIRKDGRAVMGKGIALEADKTMNLSFDLASRLRSYGNHAFNLGIRMYPTNGKLMTILTLPTKYDWRDKSDLNLIRQSLFEIKLLVHLAGIRYCYLTCPGCANGGLDWTTQVEPICREVLTEDKYIVADWSLR